MKRALLALWFMAPILCAPTVTSSQSLRAASEQSEVHSVVVDTPQVVSLPPASPEAWETFWNTLPPAVPIDEQAPATGASGDNWS